MQVKQAILNLVSAQPGRGHSVQDIRRGLDLPLATVVKTMNAMERDREIIWASEGYYQGGRLHLRADHYFAASTNVEIVQWNKLNRRASDTERHLA